MMLLDWKKCYDRIHKEPLLNALYRMGVDEPYLEMINVIYSGRQFFVRDCFGESKVRSQDTGLAQGDPLSCILLNILTTVLMHDAQARWPQEFTDKCPVGHDFHKLFGFDHVLFADDTNLTNTSPLGLRIMLHAVEREAYLYGFTLSMEKPLPLD